MFSRHKADKYGYLGVVWLSPCLTDKFDYISTQRVISHRALLSLIVFIHLRPRKNVFKYPAFFYPLKKTHFGRELFGPLCLSLSSIYGPLFHLPKT